MFQERYKKANDSILCNQQLLESLLKKADLPKRKSPIPWICAVAAVIGICVFSFSGFWQESTTGEGTMIAQKTPAVSVTNIPAKESKQKKEREKESTSVVKTERNIGTTVAIAEQAEEPLAEVNDREEMISEIPATASVVMPKTVELEPDTDYLEEIPQPAEKTEVPENQQIAGGGGAVMASVGGGSSMAYEEETEENEPEEETLQPTISPDLITEE